MARELHIIFGLRNRWLWTLERFYLKFEVWERWMTLIIGGAGTVFPCIQRYFD